jgi:hypothetical protein
MNLYVHWEYAEWFCPYTENTRNESFCILRKRRVHEKSLRVRNQNRKYFRTFIKNPWPNHFKPKHLMQMYFSGMLLFFLRQWSDWTLAWCGQVFQGEFLAGVPTFAPSPPPPFTNAHTRTCTRTHTSSTNDYSTCHNIGTLLLNPSLLMFYCFTFHIPFSFPLFF